MANVEGMVKSVEKRVTVIEKKLDEYNKQFRQIDYGALVKKLDNLDKAVGMLAVSLKDPKKFGGGKMLDKETAAKLTDAIYERKIEKERKDYEQKAEKVKKENEQMMKKTMADMNMSRIETRLKVLEAQVASALALASKK